MSNTQEYEGLQADYRVSGFRSSEPFKSSKRQRPTYARRRGRMPESFNGMHRRRRKKIMN